MSKAKKGGEAHVQNKLILLNVVRDILSCCNILLCVPDIQACGSEKYSSSNEAPKFPSKEMDWRELIVVADPDADSNCSPSTRSWLSLVAPQLRPERYFYPGWFHDSQNRQVS